MWERLGFALAGLLMIFPALIEAAFGDAVPVPHWLGLGLGVLLLTLQQRGAARPGSPPSAKTA